MTFLVHTGVRSAEAAGATWEEVNLGARTWSLPAERTKTKGAHVVPLTDATMAILEAAKALPGRTGLCFPSPRGKVLADKSMSRALELCGIDATVHGFRTSFRSWCGDTGQDRELAERALGHTFGSAVEAAYARSSLWSGGGRSWKPGPPTSRIDTRKRGRTIGFVLLLRATRRG